MKPLKAILLMLLVITMLLSCSKKTTETQNQCAKPTFSPASGTYANSINVTISSTVGATIFYTIDGSHPSSNSPVYTNPIPISTTTTIKAQAIRDGWEDSIVESVTYTIEIPGQMVFVPGGSFTMGDTRGEGIFDELPTHTVTLNSFFMGRYEVTQAEWQSVMGSNPASGYGVGDNYPVYLVSWYAILKYCNLRSINEGLSPIYVINGSANPANWGAVPTSNSDAWNDVLCNWNANGYRLPTEAEWEFAARGATNNPDYLYAGSNDINSVAWYGGDNTPAGSKPVGGKTANGLGLYDMSGNVWEWVWDRYSFSYYSFSPLYNPAGPVSGTTRGFRGGSWSINANFSRVASRDDYYPYSSSYDSGFRLVRAY